MHCVFCDCNSFILNLNKFINQTIENKLLCDFSPKKKNKIFSMRYSISKKIYTISFKYFSFRPHIVQEISTSTKWSMILCKKNTTLLICITSRIVKLKVVIVDKTVFTFLYFECTIPKRREENTRKLVESVELAPCLQFHFFGDKIAAVYRWRFGQCSGIKLLK